MCIIVAKPAGVDLPSTDVLRRCFKTNSDGAGFMIAYGGMVHGVKGLMTYEEFEAKLHSMEAELGDLKQYGAVLHFRIGTHGSKNPANTHPFPLSKAAVASYDPFKALSWEAEQGFAHNGVLYTYSTHADVKQYDVSDSAVFGKRILAPMAELGNIAESEFFKAAIKECIGEYSGSKFAIMDSGGQIYMHGRFEEENGVYYSNGGFREYKIVSYSAKPYAGPYDEDDYDSEWSRYYGGYGVGNYYNKQARQAYQEKNQTPPALPAPKEEAPAKKKKNKKPCVQITLKDIADYSDYLDDEDLDLPPESEMEGGYPFSRAGVEDDNGFCLPPSLEELAYDLSDEDFETVIEDIYSEADSLDLVMFEGPVIVFSPDEKINESIFLRGDAYYPFSGSIYRWFMNTWEWRLVMYTEEMAIVDYETSEVYFNTYKGKIPPELFQKHALDYPEEDNEELDAEYEEVRDDSHIVQEHKDGENPVNQSPAA